MKRYMKYKFRLKNQGSTLLTVIICLAFIAIIGTLMMSVTLTNLEMKIVQSKSNSNFYSCEKAMEEIRTGLQELTAQTIQEVYEKDVLVNYTDYINETMTDEDVNKKIQNSVNGLLMKSLTDTPESPSELVGALNVPAKLVNFTKYLTAAADTNVSISSLNSYYSNVGNGSSVLVKNIKITYTKDDYQTSITTDIRITLPKFKIEGTNEQVVYEQPFPNYVLIADNGIISNNNSGTNNINGSVYAGDGGILVNSASGGNSKVVIQGNDIITRGNIRVMDQGNLKIGNSPLATVPDVEAAALKPVIWANNLMTDTSSDETSPSMEINGICVVKDDLALNGYNSMVKLTGAYIGYSGSHIEGSPSYIEAGSAAMINGSGSGLDLSGLLSLMLNGRAYVSVEDTSQDYNILTGESVAFKSNQKAYLLPESFITNIKHNPISQTDGTPVINIPAPVNADDIDYSQYTALQPYKIAAKQTGSDGILKYYYFNFGSGKQADEYLQKYVSKYPNALDNTHPFNIKYLNLPDPAHIRTVGNAMSYSEADKKTSLLAGLSGSFANDNDLNTSFLQLQLNDEIYNNTGIQGSLVGSLSNDYSKMTHLLSLKNTQSYRDSDKVIPYFMNTGSTTDRLGVDYVAKTDSINKCKTTDYVLKKSISDNYDFNSTDMNQKTFTVVDGNATLQAGSVMNGILVASGDITIGDHAKINGIIISTCEKGSDKSITIGNEVTVNGCVVSGGDIKLGTDCTLQSDNTKIAPIFNDEGNLLHYLFKNMNMTVNMSDRSNSLIDTSNMITYENWRKNES